MAVIFVIKRVNRNIPVGLHYYLGLLLLSTSVINKNLAIANRSRINTNNNTMTLKSGLEVTQGH